MQQDLNKVRSRREAAELLGVSVATLDRMVRSGALPPPLQISARRVGWQNCVLVDWIADKTKEASEAA
jgi:predicted DNA-binding transcriptional regulator AlpA